MKYDVVIVGGGPAGLSAALILGRSRKSVLLCDAGTPRNAAAHEVHGFVTRDGIPPKEFRRIAREQLRPYESVQVRDVRVTAVEPRAPGFRVQLEDGSVVSARRVLLTVGLIDEVPDLPGCRDLWGHSIVQCPYCHGWEVRDQAFGVLATNAHLFEFGLFLTGWSRDIILFTEGAFEVEPALRERARKAGVRIEERRVRALHGPGGTLEAVELADGTRVPRQVLFARPAQRQTDVVRSLGLALDEQGFVRVDPMTWETSIPGIHAAGDLTTMLQGALVGAAAGAHAAYRMNHTLTMEDVERSGT